MPFHLLRAPWRSLGRGTWVIAFSFLACAAGADDSTPLAIGAKAPSFVDLPGTDGKTHSLADWKDRDIVVVVFTCNSCPFSVDYEDRLNEFAREFGPKGVALVAINVNTQADDRLDKMTERAKAKGFLFPYLHDASQRSGKEFGAKVTPHVFVLDKDRRLAYVGAVDDARKPAKVKKHYLRDAVTSLLEGKTPDVTQTKAAGCSVRYD